jgi:poly(beta-D-mannuronate) lyase
MKRFITALILGLTVAQPAFSADIYFNVEQRRQQLQSPAYKEAAEYCHARKIRKVEFIKPIDGLKTTEGYGSDNRAEKFGWFVMVLGGRALAGDDKAAEQLREGLLSWARAKALHASDESHDTYYAIKRFVLPMIVNFAIIAPTLPESERTEIEAWLDPLVRRIDKKFNGDVDLNNHRYLADSALMAWGAYLGDDALYEIGMNGYEHALEAARADGSLPFESRRGARALWYARHALTSLTVEAKIAALHGNNLLDKSIDGKSFETLLNNFINGVEAPVTVLAYSAQNYIPGPSGDYLNQDMQFMDVRGHGRHYMAFGEALADYNTFAGQRLKQLMAQEVNPERPLIDEYFGGNATCFFWEPETN